MNSIDFIHHFPNEESCETFLKDHRQKVGAYLPKGMVEYDEAYVEKATRKKVQERLKRGKGSQK